MEKRQRSLLLLVILVFIITAACSIGTQAVSNVPGWPETAAAQTWSVMQTSAFLSSTPTFTPLPATDTPIPTDTPPWTLTPTPTNTLIPVLTQRPTNTPTLTPTNTRIPPTVTRISSGGGGGGTSGGGGGGGEIDVPCYAAELVRHVTIPNGQIFAPNTGFTKIWRIRNVGSCTWSNGIFMVPARNNLWVGTATRYEGRVRPGATVDLAVALVSPSADGEYRGDWLLRVTRSTSLTPVDQSAFRVRIRVASTLPSLLWNFVDNPCIARWSTGNNRTVACPSNPSSRGAFVLRAAPATIESNEVIPAVIWSQPASSDNASINGTFPALYIRGDERFRASAGCLRGNERCNLRLQVFYRVLGGNEVALASVEEVYDGVWHNLVDDFSLAPFAGNYVSFIFRVTTLNGREPAAAWFNVQLYR